MLVKARREAAMQVRLDRQARPIGNEYVESIIGCSLSRKLSRVQLSKMGITQLQLIVNDMHGKFESALIYSGFMQI